MRFTLGWGIGRGLVVFGLTLAACALNGCENPGVRVTGQTPLDPTDAMPRTQSETIINVSPLSSYSGGPTTQTIITVAYNDDFYQSTMAGGNNTIIQGPNGRTVLGGASTLGWSNSIDYGQTWTYGGQVLPTNSAEGAAILWGDPGIAHSPNDPSMVYISNLMVPFGKYPFGGISGSLENFIGGGCVAFSSDGGMTFPSYRCMQSTVTDRSGDNYDGTTIEAGNDGEIFVAWTNLSTNTTDVWRAASANSGFTKLANPFPNNVAVPVGSHALLRYEGTSGTLYVGAAVTGPNGGAVLMISRWEGETWSSRVVTNNDLVFSPTIQFAQESPYGGGGLRRAQPYSFDVGPADGTATAPGTLVVRALYTAENPNTGRNFIRGSQCDWLLTSCSDIAGWGTPDVVGDQYSPVIRIARPAVATGGDFVWKTSWSSREDDPSGSTFIISQGNAVIFSGNSGLILTEPVFGPLTPCAASGTQYGGDYDDLQPIGYGVGVGGVAGVPTWIQTFSDSSQGCQYQWDFTSYHLHVSNTVFQ